MQSRLSVLLCIAALALGCTNNDGGYEADWDAEGPVAGGKADGLFDAVPDLAIGGETSGDVGGDRLELYRLQLQRTDRIEVSMTVNSGDLNPHLSLYYGTSTYIRSESWDRTGPTLTKVYEADAAGTYLLAARAYREQGEGDYTIHIRCVGGPCAGELPPPEQAYDVREASDCIRQARECAFARLPSYDGRVGEARARLIFQSCLEQASTEDGTACTSACEWTHEEEEDDDAASLCNVIIETLPFYADQTDTCRAHLTDCMDACADYADSDSGGALGEIWATPEAMCFYNGLNGSCTQHARTMVACGGELTPGSAGACTDFCFSTFGTFTDDTGDVCADRASDCADLCDVELALAGEECGSVSEANRDCYVAYFDDHQSFYCEDHFDEVLEQGSTVTCDYGWEPGDTSSELRELGTQRGEVTASSTLTELSQSQIIAAAAHLGFVERDASLAAAFAEFDEGRVYLWDIASGGDSYEWIRAYAGDTEVGVVFEAGTTTVAADIGDGDVRGCN